MTTFIILYLYLKSSYQKWNVAFGGMLVYAWILCYSPYKKIILVIAKTNFISPRAVYLPRASSDSDFWCHSAKLSDACYLFGNIPVSNYMLSRFIFVSRYWHTVQKSDLFKYWRYKKKVRVRDSKFFFFFFSFNKSFFKACIWADCL